KFNRAKATELAARTGQFLAMGFVLLGLFSNVWLVFIGLFVFLGAGAESQYETTRSVLSKYTIGDALMKRYTILPAHEPIARAVEQLLNGQDKEFLISEGDKITGFITRDEIIKGLSEEGNNAPIGKIIRRDILPLTPDMRLDEAYELMTKKGNSFAPVFQEGELAGVLDLENITEVLMVDKATAQS
ncbi:MAG: CBS domain-containing protein, partial [Saprospiraceae bacterium]